MKNRTFFWLLLLILIIAVIGGMYFSGVVKQEGTTVQMTPSAAVQPTKSSQNPGPANPASVYCIEQGGRSQIVTNPDGSQTGRCAFSDGRACDEWEFFRTKECK